jgi:hypothetical protein
MIAGSASASLPSRMWLGVERIGLACEIEGPMDEAARGELCAAFARAAEGMTRYPVALGAPSAEPDPAAEKVLVLRLFVRADTARPDTVDVASRTERHGLTRLTGRQTQYLPVALAWQGGRPTLAGPVAPLAIHLTPLTRNRPMPRR